MTAGCFRATGRRRPWNDVKAHQNAFAFASPDWPDGTGDNPLYVEQRYGPDISGQVYVPTDLVNQNGVGDPDLVGPGSGGNQGFFGGSTPGSVTPDRPMGVSKRSYTTRFTGLSAANRRWGRCLGRTWPDLTLPSGCVTPISS